MITQIEANTMHCVKMIPKRLDDIFEQLKRIADALERMPTYEFRLEDVDNDAKPNIGVTWTRNPSSTKVSD